MEITLNKPLCWILDNEWQRHYKECTLDDLQKARSLKTDVRTSNDIVLTDYQISKYWKADTCDMFMYFSLPSYPKKIRDRFKTALSNMSRDQRSNLKYEVIKSRLDSWVEEEKYYS